MNTPCGGKFSQDPTQLRRGRIFDLVTGLSAVFLFDAAPGAPAGQPNKENSRKRQGESPPGGGPSQSVKFVHNEGTVSKRLCTGGRQMPPAPAHQLTRNGIARTIFN
jgi:hypothetical protein